MISAGLMAVTLFALAIGVYTPWALQFRFNPFLLLSLIGILGNTFLLVYVNQPKLKTPEATWFSLYLAANILWGLGEAATRLSATPAAAIFWWQFAAIGLSFAPVAFFIFALAYVHQDNFVRHTPVILTVLIASLLIIFATVTSDVLISTNPDLARLTPWGYFPYYASTYLPILVWLLAGYVGGQVLLVIRFRHTKDWPRIKIFLFGALLPLIIGLITDGILPAFGAYFPPSAVVTTAVLSGIVASIMVRYGLLRLNPRTFAPGILQTMSEAVIVTDPKLHIEFINTGALALLEATSAADLEGRELTSLFTPTQSKDLHSRIIQPLVTTTITRNEDAGIQSLKHHNLPVSLSATKVLDLQGRLTGYSFVFTDLRQIKAAEHQLEQEKASVERKVIERTEELAEARAQLEASIRSLPFGFAIVTPHDEIAFANSQLSALLDRSIPVGLTASRKTLAQIDHDYQGSIKLLDLLHQSQATAKPIEQNIAFGPRFFRFFFMPILGHNGTADRAIGSALIMEDTTEAKALERSRNEFFSIASHELRTPLTAIRGNTDMILNFYKEQLKDPDLNQMVGDIREASLRLIAIVNDFLDISRLEQSKFVFKTTVFDMAVLASQILREYDVTGSRRKLVLQVIPSSSPAIASADADRTRQVIINLLSNSIKFTEAGSVTVSFAHVGSRLKVSVTDTGRGIPEEAQHLLFHKFQQAAGSILTRDDTNSTGLGLYISKLLIEGMGGKIYLDHSKIGQGTTFTFELPAASASSLPATTAPAKPAAQS